MYFFISVLFTGIAYLSRPGFKGIIQWQYTDSLAHALEIPGTDTNAAMLKMKINSL